MVNNRLSGFFSLGADVNKVEGKDLQKAEGVISSLIPELTLETPDTELIKLKKEWVRNWEADQKILHKKQKNNERYWKGRQKDTFFGTNDDANFSSDDEDDLFHHGLIDNLIFESLETFLPQATRRNPEPIVFADNTTEGEELSDKVRKMLLYLADILQFRLKIKSITRNWALYYVGVLKVGWDFIEDEITVVSIRPQKMIFAPNSTITEKGVYTGEYLGELREDTAKTLIKRFPAKKGFINNMVGGKLGTKIQYTEWWADFGRILFWTLKDEVLDKVLNPHWNYDEEIERIGDGQAEAEKSAA